MLHSIDKQALYVLGCISHFTWHMNEEIFDTEMKKGLQAKMKYAGDLNNTTTF